ncbi:PHA/PHB synthase family protein [Sphingopyxis alaskensis]|jgi:polyhydroxyalkanoate synthase|uniref:Poly(R)-hydroxyalkanoic acid synthase, class I n=1 Tax=Sphingopyxis alaskensis (strain DSM 13593 / LMG 18877 / RB2256) TaxID=317655 RepID=Q1GVU6_SPHAL|nr:class I poly(R)-hydroxyalkanoic acid synthase [Sphingopyxis alaskensis]ABF52226.1 Poly(R)-hydroxyalkanoic acid synthase, class I [Sphingopyxis alaskensis RB2256]MCM3419991.1 class I poly(R)-hydroxyalkanoic acid synthase [Sphingopyxis alaskensis]
MTDMGEDKSSGAANPFMPSPDDVQHWTSVMGRAQQMMLDYVLGQANQRNSAAANLFDPASWLQNPTTQLWAEQSTKMWEQGAAFWASLATLQPSLTPDADARQDKRFADPDWTTNPVFALIRQTYGLLAEQLLATTRNMQGIDEQARAKLEFAAKNMAEALSPSNLAITNPEVIKRAVETRGESLLKGLGHMLSDLSRGQLSHVDPDAFEVGVNIATTPGKVIHETDLYQLIQYDPATKDVFAVPLVIFPPWINRFYILDLNPQKSFVKWATEQGLTVFMVSWKSADASMSEIVWDDYVSAQVDAIDTVRDLLDVPHVHTIGYCVAGTTLAATLAMLAARGEADGVKSATFLTAQVDFELAGDLKLFVDDAYLALLQQLSAPGYLDGRYMAATFNSLRGRDLIWNYVVNNYLLGNDYPPFDLLYWNGDTTNLPAKWHRQYLTELYRDNRMVIPNSLSVCGTPIDLRKIATPAYIQAGREDHIAPAASVWRMMHHLSGPRTFLLAGSGHIAGVVNPPAAGKYQYWTGDNDAVTLDDFIAGATETKGSWWPHWAGWIAAQDDKKVPAKGARIPGKGRRKAIEDAPGRYVKQR